MKISLRLRISLALCTTALTIASVAMPAGAQERKVPPAAVSADSAPLSWRACEGAPTVSASRCAEIAVPLDWHAPGSTRVNLRFARLSAAKPTERIGALFFNPGGPGGSAADIAANPEFAKFYFPPQLRDRFDIVGVDPRGIGRSEQIRCTDPPHQPQVTRFPTEPNEVIALERGNAEFGKSCIEGSGKLARHLDTVSAARDLDAVRAALGEHQISFLGLSYGTMLAQAYAEQFPHRLRALVLDGVVDRSLSWRQLVRHGAAAVEDGVRRFAAWCDAQTACAIRERGVRSVITDLLAEADAAPIPAGEASVTSEELVASINGFLNSPLQFEALATALAKAADSDDASALRAGSFFSTGDFYATYRSVICQDVPAPTGYQLADEVERVRALGLTLRGASELWDIVSGCVNWPVDSKWEPHVWRVPDDFTPTLLLSGAHDVATPRPFAEAVADTIPGSTLLRWPGDGHAAHPAHDVCSARAATQYLLTVQLPDPASCGG